MKVVIDKYSGFCKGVIRAIDGAEKALSGGEKVYSLGAIVHNNLELERLNKKGLGYISLDDSDALPRGAKVLIRAHGEPPETYARLRSAGVTVLDYSCPVVRRLQKDIAAASARGSAIVIFGKKGHAEVLGLVGQVLPGCPVAVVERVPAGSPASAEGQRSAGISFSLPLREGQVLEVFSQTTKSPDEYDELCAQLTETYCDRQVVTHNTICRQVSSRRDSLTSFAEACDVIVFVCGEDSSNGRVLFSLCKKHNPRSYKVSSLSDLDPSWFSGVGKVGVSGATSTPLWLLETFAGTIASL